MNPQNDTYETAAPAAAEPLKYTLVGNGDRATISIFLPGDTPVVATGEHPNFQELRDGALAGTITAEEAKRLADLSTEADLKFRRITDRVQVAGGHIYFDGDEVHSTLATQIVRFIEAEEEDWKPLVAFMEKLAQNPSDHSRNQLYDWLSKRDFTITPDGDFIGYKGVRKDGEGNLVSITAGPAIVNGKSVNGHVPNPLGGVIEIARSYVAFDPSQGCSRGLHVGSYKYAHRFAQGALLKVRVNPRDVVSVPTECNWEKMRVCRYTVVELIDAPETEPVDWSLAEDDEDWYGCEGCGDYDCEGECEEDDEDWYGCEGCGDYDCEGECEEDDEDFVPPAMFDVPATEFPGPEFKAPARPATATAFTTAEASEPEAKEPEFNLDREEPEPTIEDTPTPPVEDAIEGLVGFAFGLVESMVRTPAADDDEEGEAEEPKQTTTTTTTAFATTQADPADHGADEPRGHAV